MTLQSFDHLVSEALAQEFSGWDFAYLDGRWQSAALPWDYREIILERMQQARVLLDMGTGGGEFLASLAPLPARTYATEGYPPNAPLAGKRLAPLGVQVVQYESSDHPILPFRNDTFDLIINRHEGYDAREVFRVLRPGGRFVNQQVGGENCMELNRALQEQPESMYSLWNLAYAIREMEAAGFTVHLAQEAFPPLTFLDVGAVVFYLKAVPWQIEDFSVEQDRAGLLRIHEKIQREGRFVVPEHRFIIEAIKP